MRPGTRTRVWGAASLLLTLPGTQRPLQSSALSSGTSVTLPQPPASSRGWGTISVDIQWWSRCCLYRGCSKNHGFGVISNPQTGGISWGQRRKSGTHASSGAEQWIRNGHFYLGRTPGTSGEVKMDLECVPELLRNSRWEDLLHFISSSKYFST